VRDETVSRNYAEALFELARRHEGIEVYEDCIQAVATLLEEDPSFRLFLETPRIDAEDKKDVVRKAFGELPTDFVNFLLVTIDKRRQRLLRDIARAYADLVDEHHNRAHVEVTVAREMSDEMKDRVARGLSDLLGKTAIPHVRVKPEVIGGIVVRAGDTIYDGSLRRRLERMRRQLTAASGAAAAGEPTLEV
jgi:F-type H+-transporting ATPase subunit delta